MYEGTLQQPCFVIGLPGKRAMLQPYTMAPAMSESLQTVRRQNSNMPNEQKLDRREQDLNLRLRRDVLSRHTP